MHASINIKTCRVGLIHLTTVGDRQLETKDSMGASVQHYLKTS